MYPLYRFITNKKYKIKILDVSPLNGEDYTDLSDVTFLIPVRIDHQDRERNLNLSIDYLNHHFKTNIIVGEESNFAQLKYIKDKCQYHHYFTDNIYTHKTKTLNQIAKITKTPIIAIWDTDVLVPKNQILTACEALRQKFFDLVCPYNGICIDLPQSFQDQVISYKYQLENLPSSIFKENQGNSLGGAIFFRRNTFTEGGMMNENFKSYGWEDNELIERFFKLGYKIARTKGALIHLEHYRGENSSITNLFAKNNQDELKKVKRMSLSELKDYIKKRGIPE